MTESQTTVIWENLYIENDEESRVPNPRLPGWAVRAAKGLRVWAWFLVVLSVSRWASLEECWESRRDTVPNKGVAGHVA